MVRWDLDGLEFHRELREEHQKLYEQTVDKWGEESQIAMAIEECAELIVALCHNNRNLKSITREDIVGEIADVSLAIEQLCNILEVTPAEWFTTRENKLKRLKGTINLIYPA